VVVHSYDPPILQIENGVESTELSRALCVSASSLLHERVPELLFPYGLFLPFQENALSMYKDCAVTEHQY
jgi:hypothetical protein